MYHSFLGLSSGRIFGCEERVLGNTEKGWTPSEARTAKKECGRGTPSGGAAIVGTENRSVKKKYAIA
jgi:hypothetical protein